MKDLNIKNIQPTKGYVLVEPAKAEEKTVSGIILPENESEKPQYGVVLAVGEASCSCGDSCECGGDCGSGCECGNESCGCGSESCECGCEDKKEDSCCSSESCSSCSCEAPVKVGDKVIYKKWGGNEFKIADTEYQFLKFEDILAVIR